jgi:hypothetical protein
LKSNHASEVAFWLAVGGIAVSLVRVVVDAHWTHVLRYVSGWMVVTAALAYAAAKVLARRDRERQRYDDVP